MWDKVLGYKWWEWSLFPLPTLFGDVLKPFTCWVSWGNKVVTTLLFCLFIAAIGFPWAVKQSFAKWPRYSKCNPNDSHNLWLKLNYLTKIIGGKWKTKQDWTWACIPWGVMWVKWWIIVTKRYSHFCNWMLLPSSWFYYAFLDRELRLFSFMTWMVAQRF